MNFSKLKQIFALIEDDEGEPGNAVPAPSAVPGGNAGPAVPGLGADPAVGGGEAVGAPIGAETPEGVPEAPIGGAPDPTPEPVSDKEVFVCPFDGSGNIYGQSDGSIKCEHCGTVFAVEVRPAMPGLPSVDENGKPIDVTEFEGKPYPSKGEAHAADGEEAVPGAEGDTEGGAEENPFASNGDDEDEDEEDDGDAVPNFGKASKLYIGPGGSLMNRRSYIEHLASQI